MNSEPGANGTILVVDDLPATISLVRTALEERGYDVLVATNGAEAFATGCLNRSGSHFVGHPHARHRWV